MPAEHETRPTPDGIRPASCMENGLLPALQRLWRSVGRLSIAFFLAGLSFEILHFSVVISLPSFPYIHVLMSFIAAIFLAGAAISAVVHMGQSGAAARLVKIASGMYIISKTIEMGVSLGWFPTILEGRQIADILHGPVFTIALLGLLAGFIIALIDTRVIQEDLDAKNQELERENDERRRVEAALRNSEKRFQDIARTAGEVLWETDLNGRFIFLSDQAEVLFGRPIDEVIGRMPTEFMPNAEAKRILDWFTDIIKRERTFSDFECYLVRPANCDPVWHRLSGGPIYDAKGVLVGIRGVCMDISAQKKSQDALRESEERFRAIFETSRDCIQVWDREHRYLDINPATLEHIPHDYDFILGKRLEEIWATEPEMAAHWAAWIDEVFETGSSLFFEDRSVIGGAEYYAEYSFMPLRRDDGSIFAVGSIYRDITDRKHVENNLRESQELLLKVIESIPTGIWVGDREFRLLIWNRGQEVMTGVAREEVLGRNIFECFPSLTQWGLEAKYRKVIATGEPLVLDDFQFDDDSLRRKKYYLNIRANALFGPDGRPNGIVLAVDDITERRRIEVDLERRDAILRSVSFSAERFLVSDSWEANIQAVVEHLGRATGASRVYVFESHEGPQGDSVFSQRVEWVAEGVMPQIDNPKLQNIPCDDVLVSRWEAIFRTGEVVCGHVQDFPVEGRAVLEEQGILSMVVVPIFLESDFWGFLGFDECRYEREWSPAEIDAIRTAANTLGAAIHREQAEAERTRLATAIEQAAEAIVVTDEQGRIEYVNPAFEQRTGYSRSEAVGRTPRFLRSGKHDDGFYQTLWQTISQGEIWQGRLTNRHKDGSLFEEEVTISSIADEAGRIQNYVALKRDITNEVNLERQLRQAQKLEAIGTLAGGIAHDFNNVLSLILGHGEIALKTLPEEHPVHFNIQKIMKAGNRGAAMVQQILTFSRQVELERRPIHLGQVIAEALELIQVSLPSTIEIQQQIDMESGVVVADPTQIHQVVMNLCANAYQAMAPHGGRLEIILERTEVETTLFGDVGHVEPGSYIRFAVRDTGHGIDHHTLQRIFDPFFSTKMPGEGTGLGLSTVHGIITSCNGAITVHSVPHEGTCFDVYLPIIEEENESLQQQPEPTMGGAESLLLVDDDDEIAQMTSQMLQQLGYEVTTCTSGAEAIDTFQKNPEQYAVVITDLIMPHHTGMDVARAILSCRPDVPIILISGVSENIAPTKIERTGLSAYLSKPINSRTLGNAIRQALDRPSLDSKNGPDIF